MARKPRFTERYRRQQFDAEFVRWERALIRLKDLVVSREHGLLLAEYMAHRVEQETVKLRAELPTDTRADQRPAAVAIPVWGSPTARC